MSINKAVPIIFVIIILLIGFNIRLYLQVNEHEKSLTELKAEILTESRQLPASSRLVLEKPRQEQKVTASQPIRSVITDKPPEPPKAISDTQYWISKDYSDDKPFGYSVWVELVAGGNLILEKCLAPDYNNIQISAENLPEQIPECTQLTKTKIVTVEKTELVLVSSKKIPMKLEQKGGISRLTLTIEGADVALEPGSKNTLWEGLSYLPSVKQAYRAAWEAHAQMRTEKEDVSNNIP